MLAVVQVAEVLKPLNVVLLFVVKTSGCPVLLSVTVKVPEPVVVICPVSERTAMFPLVVGVDVTVTLGVTERSDCNEFATLKSRFRSIGVPAVSVRGNGEVETVVEA